MSDTRPRLSHSSVPNPYGMTMTPTTHKSGAVMSGMGGMPWVAPMTAHGNGCQPMHGMSMPMNPGFQHMAGMPMSHGSGGMPHGSGCMHHVSGGIQHVIGGM